MGLEELAAGFAAMLGALEDGEVVELPSILNAAQQDKLPLVPLALQTSRRRPTPFPLQSGSISPRTVGSNETL